MLGNTEPDKRPNAQISSSITFETVSSLQLFLRPSVPDRHVLLHLKARYPSSHAHHACNLPAPIPAPTPTGIPVPHTHPHPQNAEKTHTGRPESTRAISHRQRRGTQDDAQHSSVFPLLLQALPTSRTRGRGIVPAGKRAPDLGSPGTAALLCKQHGTEPGNRNSWGRESKL